MKRSRSALARHRQRKLQEATVHVSDVSDLGAVAEIAGAASLSSLREDGDALAAEDDVAAVHQAIRVLRNVKNSVYHRAMAARALGMLILQAPALLARLGFEREDLLDALLQLVNCCRRVDMHNADTRRVHVNCCLVISMLMRAQQSQQPPPPQRLQLVVALDSELLAMPRRPTERSSAFLLLTVSGRPESSAEDRVDVIVPVNMRENERIRLQPVRSLHVPRPRVLSPAKDPLAMQRTHSNAVTVQTAATPSMRKPELSSLPPSMEFSRDEDMALAAIIERGQTPTRQFKMDRFRVVTPALVPSSSHSPERTLRKRLPVILPSRYQMRSDPEPLPQLPSTNPNQRENSSPRALSFGNTASPSPAAASPLLPAPPSLSSSLLQPRHMVEILRSGRMPISSPGYFHTHLRDGDPSVRRTDTLSRINVTEWSEWQQQKRSSGEDQRNCTEESSLSHSKPPTSSALPVSSVASTRITPSQMERIHTPEYKRERLRDILSSPIEPFEHNTAQLLALGHREATTTMRALETELSDLRSSEARTRQQTRSLIEQQRDKLPLKFLFQLPGGAAYCRDRMRRAMLLWVLEFEFNQKRMALLQWKAIVEQHRFNQRGQAYHRLAIEKRLRVAIEYVIRGFQQQALRKWVEAVQIAIWTDRDTAVRKLQRQVRRRFGLLRFLRWHDAYPVGGPFLRDVYLALPRNASTVPYRVPARVRVERRRIWFATELVQGVFRMRRFRQFLKRYRVAAIKIQARARMRIDRTQYRLVRYRIICFQAFVRRQHDYRIYQTLRRSAVLVQINFRTMRMKRMRKLVVKTQRRAVEWRLTAALRIQRMVRGFVGRGIARRLRRDRDDMFHAALIVQRAWYRRNNEWSTFLLLGCLREKEIEETEFNRLVLAFKHRFMAKQIQRAWQRHLHRTRTGAAAFIQRNVCRWIATRLVQRMRRELLAHRRIKWFFRFRHAHRITAARRLQFWWLGVVPGRLTYHLHQRRLACEAERRQHKYYDEERAATQIQRVARGRRDRCLARNEQSARVIQKAMRECIMWRRVKREIHRLKAEVAVQQAQRWVLVGCQRAFAATMARLNAAATHIQREVRGFLWRMWLIRRLVEHELNERMATRIQTRWRQNAQSRLAKRVLSAQRRRRDNPFRDIDAISHVLQGMRVRASQYFDSDDEVRGLHVAAWLRRLGLNEEQYYPLFQKISSDIDLLTQLRACGGADECLCMLDRIGVTDDDHAQRMATNLFAAQTLRDVRRRRSQLETLRSVQREDDKRVAFAQQQCNHAQHVASEIAELLEDVLSEAAEFRNPPKALRTRREKLSLQLDEAQKMLAMATQKHSAIEHCVAQRMRDVQRLQRELSEQEKDEVSAVYSLHNFKLVRQLSTARELFLTTFPGLEARALAFVGALEENQVSTWQLLTFFQSNPTIAQVKTAMPRLTYFRFATDVKKHDHVRFQACCDLLQYGFERVGEVLGVPVDDLVLYTHGGRPENVESNAFLSAMVLQTICNAYRCRQPSERAALWTQHAQTLAQMDTIATRVQSHWRRCGAQRVMQMVRSTRLKTRLRDEYLEQVRADYVTPVWQDERDKEKQEYEQWLREEAVAAREAALQAVLRFPWQEEWDADAQTWVVYRTQVGAGDDADDDYEYASERPVYSVDEEDAVIYIQSIVRRFLARVELHERRRQQRRTAKRRQMERQWRSKAAERAQTLTLRLQIAVAADARVSLWLGHRQHLHQQTQKRKDMNAAVQGVKTLATKVSTTSGSLRKRRNAVEKEEQEKQNVQNAETVAALEAQLTDAAVLQQCEATYHRSARSDHRRHRQFPITARPPNAHAQATLDFLDATQTLQRSLAPTTHTTTSLTFTLGALPFGWREIAPSSLDERPYYYHTTTQATAWDRPQYDFEAEFAAIKIQSLARVALAWAERACVLEEISFVGIVHTTLQRAARMGWIGFGLEGMSAAVFLSRLGLTKFTSMDTTLSAEELLRLSEAKLKKTLGMTADEITVLKTHAPPRVAYSKRTSPLSTGALTLTPTVKHAFNILPSERVVHQLVAQSLPNQQGRVLGLVRAVTQSTTPISYRQLEMHLRLYAGRPDDAVAHIHEIASLAIATQLPQEAQILDLLLRCVERCVVCAANLHLRALHEELTAVLRVAAALLRIESDRQQEKEQEYETASLLAAHVLASPATPLARLASAEVILTMVEATRRRCVERPTKGFWEHDAQTSTPLSAAQVALFVREQGLERVLLHWRSAALMQATYRMHRVRVWYCTVVAHRHYCATILQSAWRVYVAREHRRLLESQQQSPYEQQYDKLTTTFFFVYTPTSEKLLDEPRDAHGAMLPFRPMVQDRVTKRWLLAWPHLETKNRPFKPIENVEEDDDWTRDAPRCTLCHVERAVRRCLECVASTGDYVDACLTCFCDRHAPSTELAWHTFTPLYALRESQATAPRAFHCIECKRLSTLRCLACREHYCARCFGRVHRKGHTRARHTCEHYGAGAIVCVECEANVAFYRCLVCQDALCEPCMTRTHARGTKQNHGRQLLRQPLDSDADNNGGGYVYCEHCDARRGDATCTFCARALCHMCLADPTKHAAAACPETLLHLKKRELLGDRLCVECGKQADRQCEKCGDKYCSVKWMGNPGCFERFHYKGKRADHTCVPLATNASGTVDVPPEILELEEKVKQKRRHDAEAAEQEARAMATALAEAAVAADAEAKRANDMAAAKRRVRGKRGAAGASKRMLLGSAATRLVCGVDGCRRPTLSAAVPFCGLHLTSQHALEISKADPLEAAKLLALVEKHGGTLPTMGVSGFGKWQFLWGGQTEINSTKTKKTITETAEADRGKAQSSHTHKQSVKKKKDADIVA